MTKRKYFGTDGIRGKANEFPLIPELVTRIGMAVGAKFKHGGEKHRVVIGKDTRLSGYMIENALTAGFLSVGIDVFLIGPVPTPGVAMLTKTLRADIGVMISASHNPYYDNGIKLFDSEGRKLPDEVEKEIEELIDSTKLTQYLADSNDLGRARRLDNFQGRYIEFVKQVFPKEHNLNGLKIVLDCSNGAAYDIAPIVLWELGAEVITIGVEPNGFNINDGCGSMHPEKLAAKVLEEKADIGIALDGDADRLIIIDEKGNTVNGDKIIALIAKKMQENLELKGYGVVATMMSNLGLEKYLESINLHLKRTKVGDRYVIEEMRNGGYNLGGESSGHIIMGDYSTTGDGLLSALQVLTTLVKERKTKKIPVSKLVDLFNMIPQVLKNVKYNKSKGNPLENENVKRKINEKEKELGKNGRIFIRPSGTEPLIRIMVEGTSKAQIEKIVDDIAEELIK
ncbi:phosphoglucosamine mutase [Pseudomonadota bacterium]